MSIQLTFTQFIWSFTSSISVISIFYRNEWIKKFSFVEFGSLSTNFLLKILERVDYVFSFFIISLEKKI